MYVRSFSVAWLALSEAALAPRIAAQPLPVGSEFQVNAFTTTRQDNPSVAADSAGNSVVPAILRDQARRYGRAEGGRTVVHPVRTTPCPAP